MILLIVWHVHEFRLKPQVRAQHEEWDKLKYWERFKHVGGFCYPEASTSQ